MARKTKKAGKSLLHERFGNGETQTVVKDAQELYEVTQALSRGGIAFRVGARPMYSEDTVFVLDVEKLKEAVK